MLRFPPAMLNHPGLATILIKYEKTLLRMQTERKQRIGPGKRSVLSRSMQNHSRYTPVECRRRGCK